MHHGTARQLLASFAPLVDASLVDLDLHEDSGAATLCEASNALAVTIGSDIFLHPAARSLPAPAYRELLAHEVIHVVQNRRAATRGRAPVREHSTAQDHAECEARSLAIRLAAGLPVCVRAVPAARVQCATMNNLQSYMGSAVYNEVAPSLRRLSGGERDHAINFQYELADTYIDLQTYLQEAKAPLGSLDTLASFFVKSKLGKSAGVLDRNVKSVKDWVSEIKNACSAKTTGMSKGDIGLLLLAAAKRSWQANQLRKILDDSEGSIGLGDATYPRIALWMYNFAFYHQGELALGKMGVSQDKDLQVRMAQGQGQRLVKLFQNRIKHIVDGHTFKYYILDQDQISNLSRSVGGLQSFYPVHYTDTQVAADVEAALLNAPEARQQLAAGRHQFFTVSAPYHLTMSFAYSANNVARLSTAFPSAGLGQQHAHRIPQAVLQSIYSLMAQGLGMKTLRQAQRGT